MRQEGEKGGGSMTVKEIIEDYLVCHGYGGLVSDGRECGCQVGDLVPCDGDPSNCEAGYRVLCTDECDHDAGPFSPGDWHIQTGKPEVKEGMKYPQNDDQYEDVSIVKVVSSENGWSVERADGWGFFVPKDSPVEPKAGMSARFYGRGIGSTVRGLFLDGAKVYYRTETEEEEHREIDMYGVDAADWLKRWDEGKGVWSIEMGGLGPGYEQCIQIACAEILRYMLSRGYDPAKREDSEQDNSANEEVDNNGFGNPVIKSLVLSGAQWGAAKKLAFFLYRNGPRGLMKDERVKDRHIQVSRDFPQGAVRKAVTS